MGSDPSAVGRGGGCWRRAVEHGDPPSSQQSLQLFDQRRRRPDIPFRAEGKSAARALSHELQGYVAIAALVLGEQGLQPVQRQAVAVLHLQYDAPGFLLT